MESLTGTMMMAVFHLSHQQKMTQGAENEEEVKPPGTDNIQPEQDPQRRKRH